MDAKDYTFRNGILPNHRDRTFVGDLSYSPKCTPSTIWSVMGRYWIIGTVRSLVTSVQSVIDAKDCTVRCGTVPYLKDRMVIGLLDNARHVRYGLYGPKWDRTVSWGPYDHWALLYSP